MSGMSDVDVVAKPNGPVSLIGKLDRIEYLAGARIEDLDDGTRQPRGQRDL
jgi:hypothetical protein